MSARKMNKNNQDGMIALRTEEREKAVVPETAVQPIDLRQMKLEVFAENIGNCLSIVDNAVMKEYVTRLDTLPVISAQFDEKELGEMQFFRITQLVYQEDEFSADKLAMAFHTLSAQQCTLALMLKSDGDITDVYIGVRSQKNKSSGAIRQMLEQCIKGFFPGSSTEKYYQEEMKKDFADMKIRSISEVSSIADYSKQRDEMNEKEYIQGLEKFINAMRGRSYTAILVANDVSYEELDAAKHEYEKIYTQLSPFSNMQINFSVSDSKSRSDGTSDTVTDSTSSTLTKTNSITNTDTVTDTKGLSKAKGKSITHTKSQSESDGKTHTEGTSDADTETTTHSIGVSLFGGGGAKGKFNIGGGVNYGFSKSKGKTHTVSVSDAITKTLTKGTSDALGASVTDTESESRSTGRSVGVSEGESTGTTSGQSFSAMTSATLTDTFGDNRGITLNACDKRLDDTIKKLEKNIERIEECESYGMWRFAAYFVGSSTEETQTAANVYKAVVTGKDSGVQRSAVNIWNDSDAVKSLMPYISNFVHPEFLLESNGTEMVVDPAVLISSNELAVNMGLPRHSVRGLPVTEHAMFAQEIFPAQDPDRKKINLGNIYSMGEKTNGEVKLDLNSLAMHTFITGSTGSGKSNAVYQILSNLRKNSVPFLIIEPAKGEYKDVFPDVKCFGTDTVSGETLRINPFAFPDGIRVLEHIDRLIEIFNVCWPMYAAMPAVLKESVERAYKSAGWDLDLSENNKVEGLYPTFDDVLRELRNVINSSDYSGDTKSDYIGSLATRIGSLTNGIAGRIFVSDEQEMSALFDEEAIIDLSRIGSTETKSLIMGILVMKLCEYRQSDNSGISSPLRHITVLEEAHNLLKKTSTEQSAESSNLAGKSVEMLTNTIAEIRSKGEGFIIADQAPGLLDTAVIRNTNTKIVLRLPELNDREITGGAMALNDKQTNELAKLPTGVAAVYQNDWQEAVLCNMPLYRTIDLSGNKKAEKKSTVRRMRDENRRLLHILLGEKLTGDPAEEAKRLIMKSNLSAKIRKDLILNFEKRGTVYDWAVSDHISKNFDYSGWTRGARQLELKNYSNITDLLISNISDEFEGFNENEMLKILYYICMNESEKIEEHRVIDALRTEYLRERAFV